jgi:hypothetical protein
MSLFLASVSGAHAISLPACTLSEAAQAESQPINDWDGLYQSFKTFSKCDSASVAEQYSSVIGNLLANHWDHFPRLVELSSSNHTFKKFVLTHIDDTVPSSELNRISENARLRCPSNAALLCEQIVKATQ